MRTRIVHQRGLNVLVMADWKKSPIWSFFSVAEDSKFAKCKVCKQEISRGGKTTKTFTTSNLVYHLKYKHKSEYDEYQEQKWENDRGSVSATVSNSGAKQLTLVESQDRTRQWDINDRRAQKARWSRLTASQALSIVDDRGFQSLLQALEPRYRLPSRWYITENIVPLIHSGMWRHKFPVWSGLALQATYGAQMWVTTTQW